MESSNNHITHNDWGIDLYGQKMIYKPWPVDNKGNYLHPAKNEINTTYSVSGEAVKETTEYFQECGGNIDELLDLLNSHVVHEQFVISGDKLLDKKRWYNNEYYFYFINFTKRLIGRYDFRYGENSSESLSRYHFIYEKGFLEYMAWGTEKNGKKVKESSTENFYTIYLYIKDNYPGEIIEKILNYLNNSLKKQNKSMDISYFTNSNYWYSVELTGFFYSFVVIATNDNDIFSKSSFYGGSRLLKSLLRTFSSPKAIYKNIPGITKIYNHTLLYRIIKLTQNSCVLEIKRKALYNDKLKPFEKSINIYNEQLHINLLRQIPKLIFNNECATYIPIKSARKGDDFFSGKFIWSYKLGKIKVIELLFLLIASAGILFTDISEKYIIVALLFTGYLFYYLIKTTVKQKQYIKQSIEDFNQFYKEKEEVTAQLQKEKDLLELKVEERTKELSEAYTKLKELDKAKTNFFDNISHELRIPLTMINAPLESIINGKYGKSINTSHEILQLAHKNCLKLTRLINSLLDYSKIKNGKLTLEKRSVDIIKRMQLLISEVESLAANKNISLEFKNSRNSDSFFVMIDPYLFECLFLNLVSNAIKFTPEEGNIVVLFDCNMSKKEFCISVKDTGIGIPVEKKDFIFEKFHQIDNSANRKYDGTGIGLSLVKEILSLHHGRITVESEPGKGSNFTAYFPLEVGKEATEWQASCSFTPDVQREGKPFTSYTKKYEYYNDNKKTILLVEDNTDMVIYLTSILGASYNIINARNGMEALEKLRINKKPDLVIADIMMPVMDGIEFRTKFVQNSNYNYIPFIFLTAKASMRDKLQCLESGAIDYIVKPFSTEDLQAKIKSIIQNKDIIYDSAVKKIKNKILDTIDDRDDGDAAYALIEKKGHYYNLTKREIEILKYIYEGYQDKEIGDKLNIAVKTVSNHIYHVFEKAGISNRVELIKTFLK
ncbi:MAG: response regulator [Spirochaetales bacterium]|nr:response regulator [Spirochaetales bacterium]